MPVFQTHIQAVTAAYAALNRGDIDAFVAAFDPDVERIEPESFASGGPFRGIDAVTHHVRAGRATWAEGACEPEGFILTGDRVIAFVHVRVRLKSESSWREGHIADVFTFRDNKVIQFRTFDDRASACAWAGVSPGNNAVAPVNDALAPTDDAAR